MVVGPCCSAYFAFGASSCPCVTCLSDVEGGGLLADGSGLMQLTTRGSAASVCVPFRCHRSLVVPIEGGRPLFHSRNKGIRPETCENGKRGDAICGFKEARTLRGKPPLSSDGSLIYVKENEELHITKASALTHASSRWPRKRMGK